MSNHRAVVSLSVLFLGIPFSDAVVLFLALFKVFLLFRGIPKISKQRNDLEGDETQMLSIACFQR